MRPVPRLPPKVLSGSSPSSSIRPSWMKSSAVPSGQKPLDVALAFFEKPLRFRGLLAQAEEDDVASRLDDADLARAARQIRELDAAVGQKSAA